ncbi:MAG: O-antigen ligase family protein [Planctomycetaceae bacterium]
MFLGLLLLIAVSVWFVPLLERARLPLLTAIVLMVGTVFGPEFFAVEGPLQISIDRVLFVILCIVAFFSLRGSTASIPRATASDWLVGGLTVWLFFSATSGEPPQGSSPVGTWIFYILMPAMTYAIARAAKWQQRDLHRVEMAMLMLGLYLAVTAVFESRGWYSLVFPSFVADETHWEFLGRGRGPLLNPSANGIVMTIALAIATVRWLRAERLGRVGYALAGILMLLGLYATLTRSVWMGAMLALAIVFWHVTPRWSKVLALCGGVLIAGFAAAGLKDELLRMKRDKNLSAAEAEKSIQLRPLLAIIAFEMIKDAPLAGHGFGHYFQAVPPYYSARGYDMPLEIARGYNQHNVLLSLAVDSGLIGVSMFAAILFLWIRSGWRLSQTPQARDLERHAGLVGVASFAGYLVGGMFQDVTIMPMINMYLFFIGGWMVSLRQANETSLIKQADRRASARSRNGQETEAVDKSFQPAAC